MSIQERLKNLREVMRKEKINYYLISSTDPHRNEYLPEAWLRYQYISGFTGSNAIVLIGLKHAYFWTDNRYTEQAKIEVDPTLFQIFIMGEDASLNEFIASDLGNITLGIDPRLVDIQEVADLQKALNAHQGKMLFIEKNLIDVRRKTLPALKHEKIFLLEEKYNGEKAANKLAKLRQFIKAQDSEAIILNELPSIAWLFNLRGKDIEHNPVFLSYAIVTLKSCVLFIDSASLSPKISDYFKKLQIEARPYNEFYEYLPHLDSKKILLEPHFTNQAILNALKNHDVQITNSPIPLWKACKNNAEIQGAKLAHQFDGIAMIRFLHWLDQQKQSLTEISLAEKLLEFRMQGKSFQGTSFDTIAGFGDHGAIVHYHAQATTDRKITDQALLLIDSGGQYLEGTTDITRTIHLGEPTQFEKHCYTLVLKGQLALKNAVFPEGTCGVQLDSLARQFLWKEGYNYGHGTGHGVGAFLCVHEGPQSISPHAAPIPLQESMIVSNEPGLYLPGKFGIRIENLVYVKKAQLAQQGFGKFYTFEDLTLVPYARKLIATELLSSEEINQINAYHSNILEQLGSLLEVEPLLWLIEATKPL